MRVLPEINGRRAVDACGMGPLTMPWTCERYPSSMKHLPAAVRAKAVEIANALLDEGMEEGMAIRIAIAKAREWARHHGLEA